VSLFLVDSGDKSDDWEETALYANDQWLNKTASVWMPYTTHCLLPSDSCWVSMLNFFWSTSWIGLSPVDVLFQGSIFFPFKSWFYFILLMQIKCLLHAASALNRWPKLFILTFSFKPTCRNTILTRLYETFVWQFWGGLRAVMSRSTKSASRSRSHSRSRSRSRYTSRSRSHSRSQSRSRKHRYRYEQASILKDLLAVLCVCDYDEKCFTWLLKMNTCYRLQGFT